MELKSAYEMAMELMIKHEVSDEVDLYLSDLNAMKREYLGWYTSAHSCDPAICDPEQPHIQSSKPSISLDINRVKVNGEDYLNYVMTHEIAHAQIALLPSGNDKRKTLEDHGPEFHEQWQKNLGKSPESKPQWKQPNLRWIGYCRSCDFVTWTNTIVFKERSSTGTWDMGTCPHCTKNHQRNSNSELPLLRWVRSLYLEERHITPEFRAMDVPGVTWKPRLSKSLQSTLPDATHLEGLDMEDEEEHPFYTIHALGMSDLSGPRQRARELIALGTGKCP